MPRPSVLLLHPPGVRNRFYQLDTYCSQPQKGPFRWHPLDFATFASRLQEDSDVVIMDLGISEYKKAEALGLQNYDAIIGLIGAYGWNTHVAFWRQIIEKFSGPVWLSGDIARHAPQVVFDALPGLRGIIPEFCRPPQLQELLQSDPNTLSVWNPEAESYAIQRVEKGFRTGIQAYELWNRSLYKNPFVRTRSWASTFTQTGCPYTCSYCMLQEYQWSPRDLDEFEEEIARLKYLGVEHLYVRDATFNTTPAHIEKACDILAKSRLPWNTFARIETVEKWLPKLAESGCKVLQFGLDSPDRDALATYSKDTGSVDFANVIRQAGQWGIETVGHFVLGLDASHSFAIADYAR